MNAQEMYEKYAAKDTPSEYLFGVIDSWQAVQEQLTQAILETDDPSEALALDRFRRRLEASDPVFRYGRETEKETSKAATCEPRLRDIVGWSHNGTQRYF